MTAKEYNINGVTGEFMCVLKDSNTYAHASNCFFIFVPDWVRDEDIEGYIKSSTENQRRYVVIKTKQGRKETSNANS